MRKEPQGKETKAEPTEEERKDEAAGHPSASAAEQEKDEHPRKERRDEHPAKPQPGAERGETSEERQKGVPQHPQEKPRRVDPARPQPRETRGPQAESFGELGDGAQELLVDGLDWETLPCGRGGPNGSGVVVVWFKFDDGDPVDGDRALFR